MQNILPQKKEFYIAKTKNSNIKTQESKRNQNTIGDLSEIEINVKRKQKFQQKMLKYINSVIFISLLHNSIYFILNLLNYFFEKS